jgi:hypothetical protein
MTAQRFRKKPVEIDAMRWDGTPSGAGPIIDWINTHNDLTAVWREEQPFIDADPGHGGQPHQPTGIFIKTLEGEMHVSPGDWVIRASSSKHGVQGEFYPCKPDIFAATYDAVA